MDFNQISNNVRTPMVAVEFDNSLALLALAGLNHKLLLMGQMLSTGTAEKETLYQIVRDSQADELFGQGSIMARMIKAAREANDYNEMWVVALEDDDSGVAAGGTLTFGGTLTAAGTLSVMIAGQRVRIAVAADDTPAEVATAITAAINANGDLPVTAAVNGSVTTQVDLTARNDGEVGNSIDLRHSYYAGEALPKGLTCTIVAMSGGSGNPDVDLAIAALADQHYQHIAIPWTDAANLTALEDELESRWNAMRQIEAHGYLAVTGNYSTCYTHGGTRNSQYTTTMEGANSPTPPWEWAACYAAVGCYNLNVDPNRPLQTLKLSGLLPASDSDRLTQNERNNLLYNGMSTHTVDSGGSVLIERAVTNYRLNTLGVEDPSYLDVITMSALAYFRQQVRYKLSNLYPRHKLADDNYTVRAGQAIVRPKDIAATLVALGRELMNEGVIQDMDQFKSDMVVERASDDHNRVNIYMSPSIIPGLRVFANLVQFLL